MKIELNDPRLTAYALGELSGDALAEFEALLKNDAAAQAEVESIRMTAGAMTTAFAAEAVALSATARQPAAMTMASVEATSSAVNSPAAAAATPVKLKFPQPECASHKGRAARALLAAAASVALMGGTYMTYVLLTQTQSHQPVAAVSDLRQVGPPTTSPGSGAGGVMPANPERARAVAITGKPQEPLQSQPAVASGSSTVAKVETAHATIDAGDSVLLPADGAEVGVAPNTALSLAPATPPSQQAQQPQGVVATASPDLSSLKDSSVHLRLGDRVFARQKPREFQGLAARKNLDLSPEREGNTESYDRITDNSFLDARTNPLSTFSIDVDTASYANVRRFLAQGKLPPKDAVRIEELVNYFPYDYAPPPIGLMKDPTRSAAEMAQVFNDAKNPFASHVVVTDCPWNGKHRLVRVALKGKEIPRDQRPPSNLVFLLDVSGSMNEPNKLPLVKSSMKLLVEQLGENDRVAIAVYAGSSGLVLEPTNCAKRERILEAIDNLQPGGSTNGAAGIQLAYDQASSAFIKDGTNRVILCTDGDFNVGVTDQGSLTRLIEEKAKSGVFLSVLGFGMGNTKDSTMEKLADKGNGNYAYIDTLSEGRKVLVEQMTGTLMTIAKDVKIQIEFNPTKVGSYRLIGYENRVLAKEDFNNDKKDAGEIGAGHTVTALYEIAPVGETNVSTENGIRISLLTQELESLQKLAMVAKMNEEALKQMNARIAELQAKIAALQAEGPTTPSVDPLKYQSAPSTAPAMTGTASEELLTLKLRFKPPAGDTSKLVEFPVADVTTPIANADADLRFAASVASFGMLLRDSEFKGNASFRSVVEMASGAIGEDKSGYRKEFVELAKRAGSIGRGATPQR